MDWSWASSPSPRFPGVCKLGGSLRTTGTAKHNGDIKLYITHGLKLMQIMFLCSLSQKPPELCIKIDAKVNLGFGALYILETSVSMRGRSMLMWRARRTLQKKHRVGIWSGLQTNIQPFEHPPSSTSWNGHEHWWVDQNFRTVLRGKKGLQPHKEWCSGGIFHDRKRSFGYIPEGGR